ncbi:uncharacterized protein C8Q71DRAFT_350839 [Rhodofomes roseus]|uniref:Uncharacterized protein n=1 Tax=Rhodofomes roseus TaxID=34475 RepID=A0ABQ8KSZ7_9APHY|nr:uncharacterized protein C8Q71DRAFT_350839 [Rhodofomes roseus]KAH9841847.1 hypothetical protein C8Q71DRAFT_350839 [Rhodofomes roseus]
MSPRPDDMATQPAQTLPSFTQAFSSPSLSRLTSSNNVLPPIHRLASPNDRARQSPSGGGSPQQLADRKHNHRKRLHAESSSGEARDDESGSDGHRSPRAVRIKEEADHDAPVQTPAALRAESSSKAAREPAAVASPPEARAPPQKRRRVTISGGSNSINTNVSSPASDNIKSMSPVFMGFTVGRDDPQALEQMRSMLTVKQKQKELIEQRRGSTASIMSTAPPSVNIVNPLEHEDERDARVPPKAQAQAGQSTSISASTSGKPGGRSPNIPQSQLAADRRRSVAATTAPASSQNHLAHPHPPHPPHSSHPSTSSMRHDSPGTLIAAHSQSQQQQQLPPPPPRPENPTFVHTTTSTVAPHHTLPAPPISFANRRAGRGLGGAKGKPADIMINPRASHPENQPAIQSAPPMPRTDPTGRFGTMAVPSLPQMSATVHRHAASRVPPTPTRLTVSRNPGPSNLGPGAAAAAGRSPQNASVPIASSLVPPTPATLHHPNYSSEKSAFLSPFELFYDALADSKQLKNWLAEQMQKSQALSASLQRQQEQFDELVEAAVEKRMGGMREEMYALHQRVEELEQALRGRVVVPSQSYSPLTGSVTLKGKGKANGMAAAAQESYTFPPVDPHMRRPEPVRRVASPEYDSRSYPGSEAASPAPFDVGRRLSVSAVRMAPRSPPEPPHARKTLAVHPTARERELSGPGYPPPPHAHPGGYHKDRDRDIRAPKATTSLSQSTSRGSVTHLHPSNEDASPERRSAAYRHRAERRGSPGSSDERAEGAHPPGKRDQVYQSPPRSRVRSPMDDS